jgi:hypothetical protein
LARLLISGYPNSRPSEPEYFVAQVVTVFTKYDTDLIKRAVQPSGIPYSYDKFLPTIGEIDKWLADKQAHLDRMSKYASLPPPARSFVPPNIEPNLFIPEDVPDYDRAEAFAAEAPAKYWRRENNHKCSDGRICSGIWVFDTWWRMRSKSFQQWYDSLIKNPGMRKWDYQIEPGQRRKYTDAEKQAFLESAKRVGKEVGSMALSDETRALLREQDQLREDLS